MSYLKIERINNINLITKIIIYLLLIGVSIILLLPVWWMLITALKPPGEVMRFPPELIPKNVDFSNFSKSLTILPFSIFFKNTLIITLTGVLGQTISASLVAFGFARINFIGRDFLFLVLLSTMMLPGQVTMIPLYILFKELRWLNTFKPLIVPSFFGGGAFSIFLLRQFYMTIPNDLDDAAKIDGCGSFMIYWKILLPLIKPALWVVAIFGFIGRWNDFLGPLIYLQDMRVWTIAQGLSSFTTEYGRTEWNLLTAASTVAVLPCILLFLFAQKYFIEGITITGLKE